jgi:hypothetical protein
MRLCAFALKKRNLNIKITEGRHSGSAKRNMVRLYGGLGNPSTKSIYIGQVEKAWEFKFPSLLVYFNACRLATTNFVIFSFFLLSLYV